jgi:TPR repeat protein
MRHARLALLVAATLAGLAAPARADFNDGLRAYQSGDYATAFNEFSAEAGQGVPEAAYNLGLLFYFGLGVNKDLAQAQNWFATAATADYPLGQFMLGVMHERGEGTPLNLTVAQKWYELAAEHGHVDAQYRAGMLSAYAPGGGDPLGALVWLTLASGKGHAQAQAALAEVSVGLRPEELTAATQLAAAMQARIDAETPEP